MTGDLFYFIIGLVGVSFSIMLPLLVFQHIENRKIRFEIMNTNQMMRELMLNSNTHESKYKSINAQLSLIGSKVAPEKYKRLQQKMVPPRQSKKTDLTDSQGNLTPSAIG